jgi:hypothetical protein
MSNFTSGSAFKLLPAPLLVVVVVLLLLLPPLLLLLLLLVVDDIARAAAVPQLAACWTTLEPVPQPTTHVALAALLVAPGAKPAAATPRRARGANAARRTSGSILANQELFSDQQSSERCSNTRKHATMQVVVVGLAAQCMRDLGAGVAPRHSPLAGHGLLRHLPDILDIFSHTHDAWPCSLLLAPSPPRVLLEVEKAVTRWAP